MEKNKKQIYSLIVIVLSLVFFWLYSYTAWSVWWPQFIATNHLIFNWPDANANYFFAENFSRYNSLFSLDYLNLLTNNLLHTRSINVVDGFLVPMTFLPALLIFGTFYKLTGPVVVLFLTPLLASATVYIIYQLTYRIFHDWDLAFVTALLLLPLAPWLYFANIVMLPTILFIFLLTLGLLGIFLYFDKKNNFWFIFGSWLVIMSLAIRPTEALWVVAMLALLYYLHRKQISVKQIITICLLLVSTIFVFLLLNRNVYGDWLAFGYLNLQQGTLPTEFSQGASGWWTPFKLLFLPFGWHTKVFASNIWHYLIQLVWPYFLLALLSWFYIKEKIFVKDSPWLRYLIISKLVFILLLIYYANWDLIDPLVKQNNTISISYVRYFLPLYILLLPFVAKTILGLTNFTNKYQKIVLRSLFILALAIFSFNLTWLTPADGLFKNAEVLRGYYHQFAKVKNLAPEGSVIITERSDKIFFPYYRVVAPQGDLPLWPRIAKIIEETDVYYYTSADKDTLVEINDQAKESGMILEEISQINSEFKLLKVELSK